jgi:hypothetical protein
LPRLLGRHEKLRIWTIYITADRTKVQYRSAWLDGSI